MAVQSWKQHLTEETLERYSLGRLEGDGVDQAEEHLLVCESCQGRLAEVDEYHTTMRAGLRRESQGFSPQRLESWRNWGKPVLAMAAGILIVLLAWPALQRTGAPHVVELSATRGTMAAKGKANHTTNLRLSAEGLESVGAVNVEIVDRDGIRKWSGTGPLDNGKWVVEVDGLDRGNYWVRVYRPDSNDRTEPLREYGLGIE